MTFDPAQHFMKLKGKDYLPVAWRLVWFREDHPNWSIRTTLVEHDAEVGRALMKACIFDETARSIGEGHKMETRRDFADYLEKAETGAIGRALAALGYGTQFAPELDESLRLVDTSQASVNLPTRERDVEDVDMVRSADDVMWKGWERVYAAAHDLGLKVPEIRLPINRSDLDATGKQVRADVLERRRQLAKEDDARAQAQPAF